MTDLIPIIGLEIHIELKTKTKMFCRCRASYFSHKPNTHCCPVCLGLPGALPVPNKQAIDWVILAGLALNCQINRFSKFDRKNYFYPDLPKGYQISQYDLPLAGNGELIIPACRQGRDNRKMIKIRRVHLEEDTAKLFHQSEDNSSLIDFNRSGVPLMEIVTEPIIESSAEAKEFLKQIQRIIRYLGISDCDMEKGSMRLEVNISVSKTKKLPNYKVEIKNLNSFRFVERAIDFEIQRQTALLKKGKTPIQETRGWDGKKQVTYSQRIKEEANDYRYFPEPDIPPLILRDEEIKILREKLPESPEKKQFRFIKQYGLSEYYAKILTASKDLAAYFEKSIKIGNKFGINPVKIANRIVNKKTDIKDIPADVLIETLYRNNQKTGVDDSDLSAIINRLIKENQKAVADFQKGKTKVIGFLIGQVMKVTKGQADAAQARKILLDKLTTAELNNG
jgi:aspartyl-tRNA(Asn)/glutamyl-tRNA(Gln) amidotransferase subunit B